jgi:F-type H+-transporting ATPase subunit b
VGIDLFTFIAQIVNFLILVVLLRQLLYKRVVRAMDQREERIKARLQEAEDKQKKADEEAETYRRKQDELEQKKERIIDQAEQQADERKQDLLEQARQEVDENQRKWRDALERQKETFMNNLRETAGRQIYAAVRKVLNDLADEELEDQIIRFFIKRIKNLSKDRKQAIRSELKDSSGKVTVVTAFGINEKLKDALQKEVNDLFDREMKIEFEEDNELVCGVELRARDQTIAWSIDSYLSELEERLSREMGDNLPRERDEKSSQQEPEKTQDASEKQNQKQDES